MQWRIFRPMSSPRFKHFGKKGRINYILDRRTNQVIQVETDNKQEIRKLVRGEALDIVDGDEFD